MTRENWSDYTLEQLEALMDGASYSTLERTDLRAIIDDLLIRNKILQRVADRY